MRRVLACVASAGLLGVLLLGSGCRGEADATVAGVKLALERVEATQGPPAAPDEVPAQLRTTRELAVDLSERFDTERAMADARAIAAFGVRPGGSEEERLAAEYVARRLSELGYEPRVETFELPNGKTSRNVIASLPGYASSRTVILGAHVDTKPPSPGANDNASGCGLLLELARLLKDKPAAGRTEFVFYGTEEYLLDAPGDNHHLGSRDHAARLSAEQIASTAAMISVDMVGYGTRFHVRTMQRGPQALSDHLLGEAKRSGVKLSFLKDLGKTGWSDHEPYELRGIPAVWLQWQSDPQYHKPGDDAGHLQAKPFEVTGNFMLDIVRGWDESDLERFCDR